MPPSPASTSSGPRLAALQIVFVVSGFCGLIYESIWSHYLKLFVGHAAYAQTVVLIVFIGGMAIGAWLAGRYTQRIARPLWAYALVEALIGILSLGFHPLFVDVTGWAYASLLPVACVPETPCAAQWIVAAALILPQSILLGTTFPFMTAGVLRIAPDQPGRRIALFYFLNSIGAVGGVLASIFVLIPALGLPGTLKVAGAMNIGVALTAFVCGSGLVRRLGEARRASGQTAVAATGVRMLLLVAALTGLSSFVYEIIWIRMLVLVVGASTHAFELMLAAFILGLALGGLWVRKRIDRFRDLLVTLAVVQVLMGIAAVATIPLYDRTFDVLSWLIESLAKSNGGYALYNVASHALALAVMLPATFLAGMTLPLITTALLRGPTGEGAIGYVYAANTLGAIVGVILTVHFALPFLGLKGGLMFGAAIDVALGIAILLFAAPGATRRFAVGWSLGGVVALVGTGLFAPIAPERTASGVFRLGSARLDEGWKIAHNRDGKTATVTVLDSGEIMSIRTNGKTDASIALASSKPTEDEYTMVMTGLLPLAYRPEIQRAAVIGFGSGLTTATLLGSPNITRLDTIEIEPEIVAGAKLFGPLVASAYDDPRSHIIIDDAKSYFARSGVRYDLIISEPSNPWVSGVASLFTAEFYAQAKRQLAPRGLFVQWLQMYEFSDALMATILRALDGAFTDYAIYASNRADLIIVASMEPLPKVPDAAFTRWPGMQRVFERVGFSTVDEIEARRVAGRATVVSMLDRLGPGTNSDYYPLVDLGAPRARFLRDRSDALVNVSIAAIPVVELLEGRDANATPVDLLPDWPPGARRSLIAKAHAAAGWLGAGTSPADPETALPVDIGILRAALWSCAEVPPDKDIVAIIVNVAEYVNPYVPPAVANRLWTQVRNAPCARKLKPEERQWIALVEAVGTRDTARMAALGGDLVKNYTGGSGLARAHALAAAATGLLVQGKRTEARALLDAHLDKLADDQRNRSEFVLLLGNLETELANGASKRVGG